MNYTTAFQPRWQQVLDTTRNYFALPGINCERVVPVHAEGGPGDIDLLSTPSTEAN